MHLQKGRIRNARGRCEWSITQESVSANAKDCGGEGGSKHEPRVNLGEGKARCANLTWPGLFLEQGGKCPEKWRLKDMKTQIISHHTPLEFKIDIELIEDTGEYRYWW